MFMRKMQWCTILLLVLSLALLCACGGGQAAPAEEALPPVTSAPVGTPPPPPAETAVPSSEVSAAPIPAETESLPETAAAPEETAPTVETPAPAPDPEPAAPTCTISIACTTILDNLDKLDPDKTDFIPADGWLLGETKAEFSEGESVFDVLRRVCRDKDIHLEFTNTPAYGSVYIEGIGNIYEFDCGDLSGWMYKVNGWFPNYGCSQYTLTDGDTVSWVYTCDLGEDVGGGMG
jgi:hypothetical protein